MRELMAGMLAWRTWLRRSLFVLGVRLRARLAGATVEISVAPDARIEGRVDVYVQPRSKNRLTIGRKCRIEAGVLLELKGGTIELGKSCELRRNTVLNVSGVLSLEGNNILSYGDIVHCADRITLAPFASCSEYVTIADSRHFHTDEQAFFYDNVESAPVAIGANTWLANKSSVLMGVTIGDCATVAGHSVVTRDVPPKTLVAGAPAKPIGTTLP